jgi:hypothetical protein
MLVPSTSLAKCNIVRVETKKGYCGKGGAVDVAYIHTTVIKKKTNMWIERSYRNE